MPKKSAAKAKTKNKINKLIKEIEKLGVKAKTFTHKVVYTAYDLAKTQKRKLDEIAKIVLVKTDKTFALVIVPAGKYVDFKAIAKTLKAKKVAMASEKDIEKYLKTKVGLLHPFGNLYKIPTLLDHGIAKAKKMVAAAGSYTESMEIAIKDFEKLVQPIKGVFSKSKR